MNQRSIRVIADYLSARPKGSIVSVVPVATDDYIISITDRAAARARPEAHLVGGFATQS